jgi:hypothetical protein
MWNSNEQQIDNERLDRFGEELLHAIEASDAEINTAATSPFLYRRIRVRIEAEQRRMAEERGKWFALVAEARHAIPVLAMIAVIAIGLLWTLPARAPKTTGTSGSVQLSIITEISPLSNDEMMASIVGWDEFNSNQGKER